MFRMPTAVLMMIGHTEVMKITKMAEGWPSRNAAREGGGNVEPARRQTSSQNTISKASTIKGGKTRAAVSRAILTYLSARGGCFGVIATTGAGAAEATVTGSAFAAGIFIAGMFIESASPWSQADRTRTRGRTSIRHQHV